ncbi:MAG: hypothetical protein U5N58_13750 [Actinomycetota bacterium]|nr:hypothetical protein [Actinomycetota bacterium]
MIKKIIAFIIAALISMPFLFILPACTPSLEFGTLTICSEINQETGEPQDSKETFTIEDTSFYASMRASGVKADDNYRYTVKEKSENIIIYDETWTYSADDNWLCGRLFLSGI